MLKFTETLAFMKHCKHSVRYQNGDNKFVTNIYIRNEALNTMAVPNKIKITVEEVK